MKKTSLPFFVITATVALLAILVSWNGFLDGWQEKIFDKFFTQGTPSPDVIILAIDNESIAAIGQWPWQRTVFADAIDKLQSAAVIGLDVNFSEPSNTTADAALAAALKNSLPEVILPTQANERTGEVVQPLPLFLESTQQGLVNVAGDADGTIRFAYNNQSFPALIARAFSENPSIPHRMRIDYQGPAKTFLTLPINDLLKGNIPERLYAGKIVLIGATAPDLHDVFNTPFGFIPGIEIHANAIQTLLSQKFYNNPPKAVSSAILALICAAAAFCIWRVRKFSLLWPTLLALCLAINVSCAILFAYHIVLPILSLNIAFLATSAALIAFQYTAESKEKRFIHRSFKQYLSEDLINELINDPSKLALGGKKQQVSIIFSDIRDFTAMSEGLDPEQMVKVMNIYFATMSDIIIGSKGMIEKYIGDAICAFWGAPVQNPHHARDACRTALQMVRATQKINQQLETLGLKQRIKIGVGVNTGTVVVGNMGSEKRFNYGMVGDNVNLTSRLEGLNKVYGTEIIISEATKNQVQSYGEFTFRDLGMATVKGKQEPIHIFELSA